MTWLWVMLGSALGGVSRYWLSGLFALAVGGAFPLGTVVVNITGCFIIGFFAELTGPDGRVFVGNDARQFLMTGICGGYTTFSSFSLQTLNLARDSEWLLAGANVVLSVVLSLVAVWLGAVAAGAVNQLNGA